MNNYETLLTKFGLTAKESAVYIAALELGQADVSDIALKAGIKRPTAYFVLQDLENKGFTASVVSGKTKKFIAEDPKKILALEKTKLMDFETALPGLLGLAGKNEYKPGVRFFTGKTGIRTVYEETLLQPSGSEILALGNAQAVEELLSEFITQYIKKRVAGNIRVRAITPATPGGITVAKRDKTELRHTKILDPKDFIEPVEINIYQNKVSTISLIDKELVGIIVESKIFTAAQRQIFEMLWKNAKEIA